MLPSSIGATTIFCQSGSRIGVSPTIRRLLLGQASFTKILNPGSRPTGLRKCPLQCDSLKCSGRGLRKVAIQPTAEYLMEFIFAKHRFWSDFNDSHRRVWGPVHKYAYIQPTFNFFNFLNRRVKPSGAPGSRQVNMRHIPRVHAHDTGRQFVIWCPYCSRWHFHGRVDGLRFSHCLDHGPSFRQYELELVGPAPAALLRDLKRKRPKGPPNY